MKAPTGDQAYTLCTLVNHEDAQIQFSPYVWKTIVELRYLNINFTQKHYTFVGIRKDLAKETGDEKVLVPVLRDAEGEWMKDSFEIALHLDRAHALPKGKSLFLHGVGGREFCRFVNYWADTVLAPIIGAIVRPRTWSTLPESSASSKYFAETRFGSLSGASSALTKSQDPTITSEAFASARKALKLVNSMLAYQHTQGKKFIGGDFSHADAAVFGWYMWSTQFVPEFRTEVWENEENPAVKEWVGEMRGLPGWEEGEFGQITA